MIIVISVISVVLFTMFLDYLSVPDPDKPSAYSLLKFDDVREYKCPFQMTNKEFEDKYHEAFGSTILLDFADDIVKNFIHKYYRKKK